MTTRQPTVLHALAHTALVTPTRTCLSFGDRTWSYQQLQTDALRWTAALQRWGATPGDRVALFLENGPTFLLAYLGIQMTGAVVVLVNTQYRQIELRHILSDATVRLCVHDAPRRHELLGVAADLPALEAVVSVAETPAGNVIKDEGGEHTEGLPSWLDAARFLAMGAAAQPVLPNPSDVALIGYTSGTTGRSKGAMLTHGNLAANSSAVVEAWRWTETDRLLLTLPLFHVHGLCVGFNGTLIAGSTVDLRRRFDASDVYDALLAGCATMFFGVPTMYNRLLAEAARRDRRPAPLRLYVSGSAPLSVQTFATFARLFGQPILERYGMTETLMNLTNPYDGERRPGTVGMPFPGQEARIVDVLTRLPIRDEQPGEIQVRGPHVFAGYWRRPDATEAAFAGDGWFNTGDLGWRSADGYITISGRAHELIISGGYNIYPREVEEVLLLHPDVADVAVLGLPDPDFGEQVVAVVVPRSSPAGDGEHRAPPDPEELTAFCRDRIAGFKRPRRISFADSLPRNALGKVQKHLLKERLLASAQEELPR